MPLAPAVRDEVRVRVQGRDAVEAHRLAVAEILAGVAPERAV